MEKINDSQSTLIFLTGTVKPSTNIYLTKLLDPVIRKSQYIEAITFYLKHTNCKILFVENSGTDISSFFLNSKYLKRLEFINFYGNEYDASLGKGFGEMEIIEKAIEKSTFFKNANFIFKITGRYKILNIKKFLKRIKNEKDVEATADLRNNLRYSDSFIFGAVVDFFELLVLQKKYLNDSEGITFEICLRNAIFEFIKSNRRFELFSYKPNVEGFSGTNGTDYRSRSPIKNLYYFIKYKARYLFFNH